MRNFLAFSLVFYFLISCETNDILIDFGCMDINSCNYSEQATQDDGSCFDANECIDCNNLVIDSDGDGVGDCDEIEGCTDIEACNYNPSFSIDDGSCEYALTGFDCDGIFGLILNEVLYDPPNDNSGDANGDGTRDPNDDEFIELVNTTLTSFDLSGYKFFDLDDLGDVPAHIVPDNTILESGKSFVLFGGGDASTFVGDFGGSIVQSCSNKPFNLNNSADLLTIQDADGNTIITFDIEPLSNNPDESYTRSPDLTGEFFQHSTVQEGVLYSAGTKSDGSPF